MNTDNCKNLNYDDHACSTMQLRLRGISLYDEDALFDLKDVWNQQLLEFKRRAYTTSACAHEQQVWQSVVSDYPSGFERALCVYCTVSCLNPVRLDKVKGCMWLSVLKLVGEVLGEYYD